MKRLFDVTAAAGGIICISPVLAVVALVVRKKLGSPVIFNRRLRPVRRTV